MKSILQRMQLAVLNYAFNGHDIAAIGLHRKKSAGFDRLAIEQDRASPAIRSVAPDVSAGEAKHVAEKMYQQKPRLDLSFSIRSIQFDSHMLRLGHR